MYKAFYKYHLLYMENEPTCIHQHCYYRQVSLIRSRNNCRSMESEGKIEKLIKIIVTKNVPLIVRLSGSFKWKMYIWNSLLKLMTACDVLPKSVLQAICHNLSHGGSRTVRPCVAAWNLAYCSAGLK